MTMKDNKMRWFRRAIALAAVGLLIPAVGCDRENSEVAGVAEPYEATGVADPEIIGENEGVYEESNEVEAGTFATWDADGDAYLAAPEFTTNIEREERYNYGVYDANRDNRLTADEFGEGIFAEWDADGDGRLSEADYGAGWFDEAGYGHNNWDTDSDGLLTSAEWEAGYGQTGLFDTWDADDSGSLANNEYYGGLYDTWDADNDGRLGQSEFLL